MLTAASSSDELMNVVARSAPFQRTTALLTKLAPETVSVRPFSPCVALVGERPEVVGAGFEPAVRLVRTKLSSV